MKKYWAIVPAAGIGARSGLSIPKQYAEVMDKPILAHTLDALLSHSRIHGVIVATRSDDCWWPELPQASYKNVVRVDGGEERCHSVINALSYLKEHTSYGNEWVLVHDAARPCLEKLDLSMLISTVECSDGGGILAAKMADTVKRATPEQTIASTEDRSQLWRALTPQMFKAIDLLDAIQHCLSNEHVVTDESSAMEAVGKNPMLVEGSSENIKFTVQSDLPFIENYLKNIK